MASLGGARPQRPLDSPRGTASTALRVRPENATRNLLSSKLDVEKRDVRLIQPWRASRSSPGPPTRTAGAGVRCAWLAGAAVAGPTHRTSRHSGASTHLPVVQHQAGQQRGPSGEELGPERGGGTEQRNGEREGEDGEWHDAAHDQAAVRCGGRRGHCSRGKAASGMSLLSTEGGVTSNRADRKPRCVLYASPPPPPAAHLTTRAPDLRRVARRVTFMARLAAT